MESGEEDGVATLHHHEGEPVQAEADGWVNRNDLLAVPAIVSAREEHAKER